MLGTAGLPLVFKSAAAKAAPSITHTDVADSATNVSSLAKAQAAAQVAGNAILVFVWWQDTSATPTGTPVTDTAGNTYVDIGHIYDSSTGLQSVQAYLATNIAAASAGANTVTMHWGSNATLPELQIHQLTPAAYDSGTFASNKGASGNTTVNITTVKSNDLVVAFSAPANDNVKQAGSSGTLTSGSPSSQGAGSAYQTQATPAQITVTVALVNATNAWDLVALGLYTP